MTVVALGSTGLQVTETDSYVVGLETYRTDVVIGISGTSPADVILYRAGDCFLQNSDEGFGAADAATGSVSSWPESMMGTVGSCLGRASSSGSRSPPPPPPPPPPVITPFANICALCSAYVDNGAGLNWNVTVPAGGSVTRSHLTLFSPLGIEPLTTTKTAAQPSVSTGASDTYTITIANPNSTAVTLASITDTLPAGFTYTTGSTTGPTTADPVVSGPDLTWNGPFTVPTSDSLSLTFGVTVSNTPGSFTNEAGANAESPFVVVGSGQTAPVTVVATKAHLTLTKSLDNTGGGTAEATDWTLSASGPTPITGHTGDTAITDAAVDAGTYALAESNGPPGYSAGIWSCSAGTLTGASLVLAAGDSATCTITNTFIPPSPAHLTLTKSLDNTGGGTAEATDWTLQRASRPTPITGHTGDTAITDAAVDAGTYALAESNGSAWLQRGHLVLQRGHAHGRQPRARRRRQRHLHHHQHLHPAEPGPPDAHEVARQHGRRDGRGDGLDARA